MNELQQTTSFLTPIEVELGVDENGMTTARKLYSFLELRKADFARWAKTNITENEFATENFTSILSTHYVEEAVKLGDYIHLMSKRGDYERIKNPLKKPREKDNEFNMFVKYIKEKYIM